MFGRAASTTSTRDACLRLDATLLVLDEILAVPIERLPAFTSQLRTQEEQARLRAQLCEELEHLDAQLHTLRELLVAEHRHAADWATKTEIALAARRELLAEQAMIRRREHREHAALLVAEIAEYEGEIRELDKFSRAIR